MCPYVSFGRWCVRALSLALVRSLMELNCYRCTYTIQITHSRDSKKKKKTHISKSLIAILIYIFRSLVHCRIFSEGLQMNFERIRWYSNMHIHTLSKANTIDSSVVADFFCTFKTVHWTEFAFNLLNSIAAMNSVASKRKKKTTFIEILIVTLLCEND